MVYINILDYYEFRMIDFADIICDVFIYEVFNDGDRMVLEKLLCLMNVTKGIIENFYINFNIAKKQQFKNRCFLAF